MNNGVNFDIAHNGSALGDKQVSQDSYGIKQPEIDDLDKVFGISSSEGNRAGSEGNKANSDDPFAGIFDADDNNFQDKKRTSNSTTPDPIDYINRMHQSKFDKAISEYNKFKNEAEEKLKAKEQEITSYKEVANFINKIYEDEEVKNAFLYELAPDKFQAADPHSFIKGALAKEFGENYNPDADEDKGPGSKAWLYERRAADLYNNYYKEKPQVPKSLKEIREKAKQEKQKAYTEAQKTKEKLMENYKWDDPTFNNFVTWASKIKLEHMGNLYNKAIRNNRSSSSPHMVHFPGESSDRMSNNYFEELDKFYGKN